MCGIAGYFGTHTIPVERVETCLQVMHRRGPDQAAYRHFQNAAGRHAYLLFSRLSIIDLAERSHQPFNVSHHWMTFNGELYNYLERRTALAAQGRTFRTQSDTEVLLTTLDAEGWEGLEACEGMWAFAAYDEQTGSLMLSRDRFGEKPLYLYRDATGLYYGSEIKFIATLLGRRLEINFDHVYRYLVNGYKALYKKDHSFFKGLTELRPATVLRINAAGEEDQPRYWSPRYEQNDAMTYDEAVAGARERLIRSVELRLRADVPLAFCMSGGVDSNALISIAKRKFNYDVHGFTIVNTDARYEEQTLIDTAVKELGIRHTPIPLDPSGFIDKLRALVNYHDAPVYTITYYVHWLLQESIHAHGYRIAISGTAADELFSGYFDHHLAYLYEVRNDPITLATATAAWAQHIRPIVRNPYLSDPALFMRDPEFRGHIFLDAEGFQQYLTQAWAEPFAEAQFTPHLLRNRMLNELFHEAVPVILHEDDLNAMYYSVENRSPFLDRDLFEFCNTIPTRHLIRDGAAKAILRDAMRGIVPDPILDSRRKVGFNAPILDLLDTSQTEVRAALLDTSPIFDHVRRDKIEALLTQPQLANSASKFLFYFLNAKLFLEAFG